MFKKHQGQHRKTAERGTPARAVLRSIVSSFLQYSGHLSMQSAQEAQEKGAVPVRWEMNSRPALVTLYASAMCRVFNLVSPPRPRRTPLVTPTCSNTHALSHAIQQPSIILLCALETLDTRL